MNSTIPNNDAIDLRTLVRMLRRQFKLLMIITVAVTVLGSAWSLTRPQQYRYYQAIRLAHYYTVADQWQLLQPATETKDLIEQIYLPAFQQTYRQQHPDTVLSLQNHYTVNAIDSRNLYLTAEGDNHFKEVFVAANQYFFKKISQEQQQHGATLLKSLQARIHILSQQIPELEKLQKVEDIYMANGKNSQDRIIAANNYIESLIAQQNQNKLIRLKMDLTNLQNQAKTMISATLGPVIQTIKPQQLTPAMKILLSLFAGLLLGVTTVFLKESYRDDN